MSLLPRFGNSGRLRLPSEVRFAYRATDRVGQDDVMGVIGEAGYDPFERRDDGLLLVESFARADLARTRTARAWYLANGVPDLRSMFPHDFGEPDPPRSHDARADVLAQQANVRWHLLSLVRLSDHLDEAERVRARLGPSDAWDRRWVQPAIAGPQGILWPGADTLEGAFIEPLMQRHAEAADVHGLGRPPGGMGLPAYRRWWRAAHVSWTTIVDEGIPVLWVPGGQWRERWASYDDRSDDVVEQGWPGTRRNGRVGWNWWALAELERSLMQPYVRRAADNVLMLDWTGYQEELTADGTTLWRGLDPPLLVEERRRWTSILAPVYLQLLEGLRRVTEGRRGAALCRECGQPFLTLDARRSAFCTEKERFRHAQRQSRGRRRAADDGIEAEA